MKILVDSCVRMLERTEVRVGGKSNIGKAAQTHVTSASQNRLLFSNTSLNTTCLKDAQEKDCLYIQI